MDVGELSECEHIVSAPVRVIESLDSGVMGQPYIVLGKKVERAEDLVIFEVERLGRLEVPPEGIQSRRLDNLLGGTGRAEVLLLGGHPGVAA
jgi:hypothetical protein